MSKIKFLILFSFLFLVFFAKAQDSEKKRKFVFQLDNRFSSIKSNDITILGAKVGLQYKNLFRYGIGGSLIVNPVKIEYYNKKTKINETNKLNFWYVSGYIDWFLYKNEKWDFFITEQLGYGKPQFVKEIDENIVGKINVNMYINEISTQLDYRILPYAGIGVGFGYRNILNQNEKLKSAFNAPVYIVKIIIHPEVFFKKKN